MSVLHIRESPYCRGFFFKKIYENFVRTLETVRNIEVSIRRGWTVFEWVPFKNNVNVTFMCYLSDWFVFWPLREFILPPKQHISPYYF